jgi:1-acyl-sn-glycerol-3-phosphate acyltransferase
MVASAAVPAAVDGKRPWEPAYDAVAFGMWIYTRSAFRVETLGALDPEPGLLLVSTHRAESDVPVICPSVYGRCRYFFDRGAPRLWFAARDDMFDRGFFAGFPPGVPGRARRALYPLRAGAWLPRVRVAPVPYPSIAQLRMGRALEALPAGTPLGRVLSADLVAAFRERAKEAGLAPPQMVGDVLRGDFADVLWRYCGRDQLADEEFAGAWQQRATAGAAAIRQLVELHRSSGGMLLVFPEGKPSPDGGIGPLQPGLDLLVRRARPTALAPLALAYDPLTPARPRVVVSFGSPGPAPDPLEQGVVAALRATMPLTTGQAVSAALVSACEADRERMLVGEIRAALEDDLSAAETAGRPIENALAAGREAERLSEALTWLVRRGLATARDRRRLDLSAGALLADGTVRRLAREYTAARERAPQASL